MAKKDLLEYKDEVIKLYLIENKSANKIADILNTTKKKVLNQNIILNLNKIND